MKKLKGYRTYICLILAGTAYVFQNYPPPFLSPDLIKWCIPVCLAGAAFFRARATK